MNNSTGNGRPLVTVIIPSYNHRAYIEAAIDSVLRQTYRPIQLIVVDDGSEDGSIDLLQEKAKKSGFEFLSHSNRGVCATLNRGVQEAAKGQWIALLGSDDLWREDKIERQVDALLKNPESQFCYSQALAFQDGTPFERGRLFPSRVFSGELLKRVFARQHVPAGTMLFSRSLYDLLGGFDERLKEEDWDWVIRSAAATKFVSVREPLLFYRLHSSNTMRVTDSRRILHQKILLLAKNYHLVSPWRWLYAVSLHFAYNIIFLPMRRKLSR